MDLNPAVAFEIEHEDGTRILDGHLWREAMQKPLL
jgi:hypothetical protein